MEGISGHYNYIRRFLLNFARMLAGATQIGVCIGVCIVAYNIQYTLTL